MSTILLTKENGVGYITFNRPDKFNSFNREMALAYQEALDNCEDDETVRSIYVSAVGKAFCAGQDLAEAIDPVSYTHLDVYKRQAVYCIRLKPVIF